MKKASFGAPRGIASKGCQTATCQRAISWRGGPHLSVGGSDKTSRPDGPPSTMHASAAEHRIVPTVRTAGASAAMTAGVLMVFTDAYQ